MPAISNHYHTVEAAITFIREQYTYQPSLEEIATHLKISPWYLQKVFTEWAGISPKKFLQYTTLNHARKLIRGKENSLFDTAHETGLSGTGRLHHLFITIEAMTPGEYKDGGRNLDISFSYSGSPFGRLIIASTPRGICHISFIDSQDEALSNLEQIYPNANLLEKQEPVHRDVIDLFNYDAKDISKIPLHIRGTEFQLKVWEALLKIPAGNLSTYGEIAAQTGSPGASRAAGSAIGNNPVAYLIPCHRVIRSDGHLGGYIWGEERKQALIGWESAQAGRND